MVIKIELHERRRYFTVLFHGKKLLSVKFCFAKNSLFYNCYNLRIYRLD